MIISFSQLGKHGRLGNQLFQIASTLGLAERYRAKAIFPSWNYGQYFENYLPSGNFPKNRVTEEHFHFYDWNLKGDTDLYGYLQSPRYFGNETPRLKPAFVRDMKSRYPIFQKKTICIQVRRGDYVGNPNYYQVPITYYIDALETYFPDWQSCNILVISDDIEYCRVHFECLPNVTFSTGLTDIEDMALASNCDGFIISNSTFGWWTAWFGWQAKPDVKVVYPGKMFEGKLGHYETKDYWPLQWIPSRISGDLLNLSDVTFTIPVFFDHMDRRNNLNLSLCMLQKHFRAKWVVCEQGGSKFQYVSEYAQYVINPSSVFHRTRMLNQMAKAAETPYIVNWDCDVFVPPIQLYLAVLLLRSEVSMVYPYDGRFARMQRVEWYKKLERDLDIGIVRNTSFKGREQGHMSAGGAVLFNRKDFIEGGMENQHMISFGPEDWERHDRFRALGYTIGRIKGALFHMSHFVGKNSSSMNPHFRENHLEYEKIKKMTPDALREYIGTWEWCQNLEKQ